MDHSVAHLNIMNDKRGSAVLLLGTLFIFSFFILSMFVMDYMVLKAQMQKSQDAVTAACLAASGQINQEALSYNVIEIDSAAAEATFLTYLDDNLQVTGAMVEEFVVYNQSDLPAVCSSGNTLTKPSVHVIVPITLARPALRGLLGATYNFTIHIDCNNTLE